MLIGPRRFSHQILLWALVLSCWCRMFAGPPAVLLAAEDPTASQAESSRENGAPLFLATDFQTINSKRAGLIPGILLREIVRQGVLIAARDGLGLPTRDQTLREPRFDADGKELDSLHVTLQAELNGKATVELYRRSDRGNQVLWNHVYKFTVGKHLAYVTMLPQIEEASRTTFVEVLRKAGYDGKPNRSAEPAKIPAEIEDHLARMNFVSQFAAVRWAHEDIRSRGESTSSLGVLVRGYSHLSLLTEFHWNSMHSAYKARALLYAERMLARDPGATEALWYRAYAQSMIGIHKAALDQLQAITAKSGQQGPDFDALPTCMRIVDARCRFDLEQLQAVASKYDSLRPLAHFLIFRTRELMRDVKVLQETAKETRRHCPDAYSIFYALYYQGDEKGRRKAAEDGSAVFGEHFTARMREVGGLPDSVEELLEAADANSPPAMSYEIANELVSAGTAGRDVGEPSWAVLGRMAQEVTFVQAVVMLREESSEFRPELVKAVTPFVEGHPYAPVIESFAVDRREDSRRYLEILNDLELVDLQYHMQLFLSSIHTSLGRTASYKCTRDFTTYDLFHHAAKVSPTSWDEKSRRNFIRQVVRVSPYSPDLLRLSIILTDSPTLEELAQWELGAQRSTDLLYELAKAYTRVDGHEGAVRCLEKVIDHRPTRFVHTRLANAYAKTGKDELWLPTMKKFLETPETGFDHAWMRVFIARGLMERGRWDEAKPFALAAADFHSGWGMECAANYFEGIGDLGESQRWMQRCAKSYPGYYHLTWHLWCRRNGRADVEQSHPTAFAYANTVARKRYIQFYHLLAAYCLVENHPEQALSVFLRGFKPEKKLLATAHALLLSVELDKPDVRDKQIATLAETYKTKEATAQGVETRYARILEASLGSTPPKKPDPAAVKDVLDEADPVLATQIGYVIGRTFELCGDRATAEEYYRKTVKRAKFQEIGCTLAGFHLHQKPEAEKQPEDDHD